MTEIIHRAKAAKSARLNEAEYLQKLREPKKYHQFKYDDLKAFVVKNNNIIRYDDLIRLEAAEKAKERYFLIDQHNEDIFEMLCLYFSGDESFEMQGDGFSLDKGIMLFGGVGCGKTTLMKMFSVNSFKPFAINPCRIISDEYAKGGSDSLYKYSELQPVYPHLNYGIANIGRSFDDLGTEDNKSHFGNKVNVMQDIFYKIYENNLIGYFHTTTNITGDEIGEFYGSRIKSRMREMFNVIVFDSNSPDRRK